MSAWFEYVGESGTGNFTQSGGANTISNSGGLTLGCNSGSSGTYSLSGGSLYGGSETVGGSGTGNFTQSGGTDTGSLTLGYNSGSSGTYSLSGSGLLSAPYQEYVGYSGAGNFTQTGGTNTISGLSLGYGLLLGYNAGSGGAYTLSGSGLLSAANEYVGGSGAGSLRNPAALTPSPILSTSTLAPAATGPTASAVSACCPRSLNLSATPVRGTSRNPVAPTRSPARCISAMVPKTPGAYNLSGSGRVSAPIEYIGYWGTGNFTQSGGTNAVSGTLYLGASGSGSYSLSGSGLLSAGNEYVAYFGTGNFTQSGGTNISGGLELGYNGRGTYNLNGGTLILPTLSTGSGTAAFNFGGGTLQASGPLTTTLPMTLTGSGGNATIDTAGYIVTLSGSLSGPSGLTKTDSGTLVLSASNTYTGGTMVSGGILQFNGNTTVPSGSGNVSISNGAAVALAPAGHLQHRCRLAQ